MKVYGLTGGIASGKNAVAQIFENWGAGTIDADQLARIVVEPGKESYREILDYFGTMVLSPDGTLDRAALRKVVFDDEAKRKRLEAIVHPRIQEVADLMIADFRRLDKKCCIYHAALLVETGAYKDFDGLIVIKAELEQQIKRLMERDGITHLQAEKICASQAPLEEKLEVADFVIDNSGSLKETVRQVRELCHYLDVNCD